MGSAGYTIACRLLGDERLLITPQNPTKNFVWNLALIGTESSNLWRFGTDSIIVCQHFGDSVPNFGQNFSQGIFLANCSRFRITMLLPEICLDFVSDTDDTEEWRSIDGGLVLHSARILLTATSSSPVK